MNLPSKISLIVILLLCFLVGNQQKGNAAEPLKAASEKPIKHLILPGKTFLVKERPAFIFEPKESPNGKEKPWIFYSVTLPAYPDSHEKWMHEQFLAAGVAVAGIDVGEAYGSPASQKYLDAMYHEMVKRGYSKKPCLLGRSRGGLWASSWAIRHPEKVAGLAGIYPVYDLTTYPGIKRAAPAYEMSPEELKAKLKQHNPIEKMQKLAKAGIPVYLIHGKVDKVVPLKENSARLQKIYQNANAESLFELKVIPDQGHNFWPGFFRCQDLIDFAIEQAIGKE